VPARVWLRTAAAFNQPVLLLIGWCALLTILIAGPWLAGGYLFGTDWPGPRRIDFPTEFSNLAPGLAILAVVSRVLTAELTTKLLVIGILFACALTAFRALPAGGFIPRGVAALVFVLNPFVYGRLNYGQYFVLAGYATLPWVLERFGSLMREPTVRNGVIAGLALVLSATLDLHMFLIAVLVAVALVAPRLKHVATSVGVAAAVALIGTSYWLVPLILGRGPTASVIAGIGSGDIAVYAAVPDQRLGLLPNLLGLYGFWAEDTERFASMKLFVPGWPVILAALLAVAAIGAVVTLKRGDHRLKLWVAGLLAVAVVSVALEAGISSPLTSGLAGWLYAHVPFYRGMRDAGKWAALLALVYSQLVGLGAAVILDWISERQITESKASWAESVAIGLLLAAPLYYGNGLLYGAHGRIVPSEYPAGWYQADRVLAADPHPDRTLFLPWHLYMDYSFIRNQNAVVASPAPSFFSTPVVISGDPEVPGVAPPADPEQRAISALVAQGRSGNWGAVLVAHHIKYVLLARETDWSSYTYLDNQPGLTIERDFGSILLFRVQGVT
jgi:hypothetical protein